MEFFFTGTNEYDFEDTYPGGSDLPLYDITNFLTEDPITGYQDVYYFNFGYADTYPTSAVVDTASFQIANIVKDAFNPGQAILFPYFFASFASISELIQSISLTMSGSGYSEQFTPVTDEYMNNFHPVYEEDVRALSEDLKLMMMDADEQVLLSLPNHSMNPVGELAEKFKASKPEKTDFDSILKALDRDGKSTITGWNNPSGGSRGGSFATV